MMKDPARLREECRKKAKYLAVLSFFLCGTPAVPAASNVVSGLAFGTNYAALATAESIASVAGTNGSIVIGYAATANLTLSHGISGFVAITNRSDGFTVDATGAALTGSEGTVAAFMALGVTNLTVANGLFIGAPGVDNSSSGPPVFLPDSSGGWIADSSATLLGSKFSGTNATSGFIAERSEVILSNVTVRGGASGVGLYAIDDSTVTIHSGSFTGGTSTTAFYLQDSDATVFDGTFIGNTGGPTNVAGTGLFSELTAATTNQVDLLGGTFSSLAFYGVDGSVQAFLAGTNLVVQNGIVQNGGTVIVDNRADSALADIVVLSGTMSFPSNTFTLADGGRFVLYGEESAAHFTTLNLSANATMDIGLATVTANEFFANSFSSNLLAITDSTNGLIAAHTAWFETNSVLTVDATAAGMSSVTTNDYALISADSGQLFAGSSTNSAATAEELKDNVTVETSTSDRTRFIDLYFDTVGGKTLVKFQFTAKALKEYWDLTNGTSTVVTEAFADELDQLASGDMLAIIDGINNPAQSLAAVEDAYFTSMNTFQTVLNGMQAAVGQSVARGAEFREQIELRPSGARGPEHNSDLRGWAKYYGQRYSHDAVGLNPEYDTSLDGGVIGVDKSIGSLLVGIDGGWGRYSTTAGSTGEEEISAYHGGLYGTLGFEKAYIDAGAAYGFNEVETRTRNPFILNGEFDAQILSGYLGGGIDLIDSTEGMIFTPEASIQYSLYEQEAYSETGTTAVPRRIDAFDADSLRSSVGLNVSVQEAIRLQTFSFKYDVRFHWIREYNPDPGSVGFGLEGGDNGYQLAYPILDENLYRAGVGAVFYNTKRNQPRNVLFRVDFDELFGDGFNSHNFSAKVIYAF